MASVDASRKYDRQIRVWGDHGQARLSASRVCVLHGGPAGSEALKNLVLGGIASYTVVDANRVTERDLGNNFLLDASFLGEARAKGVSALAQELNETVDGRFVEEEPGVVVANNPAFFRDFDLVVGTQLSDAVAAALDDACRSFRVPLILCTCVGFAGTVRLSAAEHAVLEAKPDNVVADLRIARPWPELVAHAAACDVDALGDVERRHVPWVVLLLKHLAAWRASTNAPADRVPATSQEKREFRDSLRAWGLKGVEAGHDLPDNFREALQNAYLAWTEPGTPASAAAVLSEAASAALGEATTAAAHAAAAAAAEGAPRPAPPPACADAAPTSAAAVAEEHFWALARAVGHFAAQDGPGGGLLPLEGSLPDMTATTEMFLALQKVYHTKAEADAAAVAALTSEGAKSAPPGHAACRHFAKHCRHMAVLRWRRVADELRRGGSALRTALAEGGPARDAASLYVLLRARDALLSDGQTTRAFQEGDPTAQEEALRQACGTVLASASTAAGGSASEPLTEELIPPEWVSEVARWGASEVHTVGSVIGGVAAQEAIKLLTRQFVPLDGTLVYNAVRGDCHVLDLGRAAAPR